MVNFRRNAGRFFFYWLMCGWCTLVMSHLFRSIGAVSTSLAGAMTPATVLLLAMIIYTGFVIPTPNMLGWSRWINYINPVGYVFESLMVNEFHDREFECSTYIPSGGAYESISRENRACSAVGSTQEAALLMVLIIWLRLIDITTPINGEIWVSPLLLLFSFWVFISF